MLRLCVFDKFSARTIACLSIAVVVYTGVIFAPLSAAEAQGVNDALSPIMDSTENDPAGAQLMFICIGLLVTLVMSIFAGTMYFMLRPKKRSVAPKSAPVPEDETD